MKFRPTTPATVTFDLARFTDWVSRQSAYDEVDELRTELATWLNKKLDQLLAQDAFGTEGQADPRGDHRD